ncbi:MAG: zinc ribbon domain-containing protein [Armatimonadota bacterium]|nr:MAG: zinc ribbon domain-containing protein [Armatimonadota bacterium]
MAALRCHTQHSCGVSRGTATKDYCIHCARLDGRMQWYEEKLDSMAAFIVRSHGLDGEEARAKAKEMMAELPAWKSRSPD